MTLPGHPDRSARRRDLPPDPDIEKVLIQAMNDYERSTPAPAFDSDGIQRRTRRRRATFALTTCAAVLGSGLGLIATLDSPSSKPAGVTAAPASTPVSPTHPNATGPGQPAVSASDSASNAAGRTVTVPDLIGMNQTTATQALAVVGLNSSVGSISQPTNLGLFRTLYPAHANLIRADGTITPGTVTMTQPAAGTHVAPGDYVGIMLVHS